MTPRKRSKQKKDLVNNLVAKPRDKGDYLIYRIPNTRPRQELTLGYIPLEVANEFARTVNRDGWPANLTVKNVGGSLQFTYTRPDDGKAVNLRTDTTQEAIAAAVQANQLLSPVGDAIRQIMAAPTRGMSLVKYIEWYQENILPEKRTKGQKLSRRYIDECNRHYRRMRNSPLLQQITLKRDASPNENLLDQEVIAAYINEYKSAEVFNRERVLLIAVYTQACSDAKANTNIPSAIKSRDKAAKVRRRVATPDKPGKAGSSIAEGFRIYDTIFKHASFATRVAMEIALNVLQRRTDIHRWRLDWSHDDDDGTHVYIQISKTKKHSIDSYIRVPHAFPLMHSGFGCKTLGELILVVKKQAMKEGVRPQHLIYEKPKRYQQSKEKEHPFQRSPKQISDDYREARDSAGVYDHLNIEERPGLHELIAFGEHVLKFAHGWTDEQIQQLRGHTNTKMTKVYLEGHEYKTVVVPNVNG